MKGHLILNRILVHKVSKKHKALISEQSNRPILVSEVEDDNTFKFLDSKSSKEFDWVDHTIPFSWMTREKYQETINLPLDLLNTVRAINDERNQLHFIKSIDFSWGPPVVRQYEKMIEFVDKTMVPCLTDLNRTLDDLRAAKRP